MVFTIVATTPVGLCRNATMHTATPRNGPTTQPAVTIPIARASRTAVKTAGQRPTRVSSTTYPGIAARTRMKVAATAS